MRSEVFRAVKIWIVVFWVVRNSSETLVTTYKTTMYYNPEEPLLPFSIKI
jgi:hypothetical protein